MLPDFASPFSKTFGSFGSFSEKFSFFVLSRISGLSELIQRDILYLFKSVQIKSVQIFSGNCLIRKKRAKQYDGT